ncbi:hypothetical protein SAY86_026079 [Trapa natans]|uniref:Small ribosomal subunit protein mS38 n=1 Tax=Trapa natans TaxID=22666 RepID=A0AAN7QEE2_TRANT|nr:hypothetical protein SAY86_026079 [Trapa natans]
MASALQKLLRRSQIARAISTLQNHKPPYLFPAFHILDPRNAPAGLLDRFLGGQTAETHVLRRPAPIFPSFRLGIFAEPVFVVESNADEVESEKLDGTLWADSVKKKRKKKMNKHKYKKLRKRLRRQT